MADGLRLVLWSLAEYFNYFSITLIVLCFALMTAFIIRLNGDQWGHYHHTAGQGGSSLAEQKDVTEFTNPFFLSMSASTVSSLSDGVFVELSCLEPCEVYVYWGAGINPVHTALQKTGADFISDARREVLFSSHVLSTSKYSVETTGKRSLHLKVPTAVTSENLGPPPRQCYPCVVVMATRDNCSAMEYTDVVAMVTVLHLKDSVCNMETHIISQYAKMAGQAVYNLQPLFFASMSEDSHSSTASRTCHGPSDQQEDQQQSQSGEEEHRSQSHLSSTADTCSTYGTATGGNGCSSRLRHIAEAVDVDSPSSSDGPSDFSLQDYECVGASSSGTASCSSHQIDESELEPVLQECIVCQHKPLNYVLLPCRHACVCQMCFRRLDRCPMCRSHIESYFTLREEEIVTTVPEEPLPMDFYSRFERFNQRLNTFFGFDHL